MISCLGGACLHPIILALCAAGVLLYGLAARRFSKLPALPAGFLLAYIVLRFSLALLPQGADPRIFKALDVSSNIAFWFAVVRAAFSFIVDPWFSWRQKARVSRITRDLILLIAYALIIFIVLRTRGGVNLVGLITTSAVLTAVIGLAAQNFLGNLFSGIAIQIEQPFKIGDWIEYSNYTGKVVHVGWEAVHIKTFDDELIIIPNLDLAKNVVKNHSRPTVRHAMKIDVGVEYGASPQRVKQALLEVCREEPRVLEDPPPVIRLMNYGDFAITYQIRFFYNDFGISPDLRPAMMRRMWYSLRRHGIRIPFPIRDIAHRHIERRFEAEENRRLRSEALAEIASIPLLKPLSEESLAVLAGRLSIEEYGDREVIVYQGDPGDSLYILHRGTCNVEIATGTQPTTTVATLIPPAFFGEMSLLTGEPRSATVRAVGDTLVFVIERCLFRDILVAHPEVSEALAQALAVRQADTANAIDRGRDGDIKQSSTLLEKIKLFFGV